MERKRCGISPAVLASFGRWAPNGGACGVYTAPEQYSEFFEEEQLDGGAVLPGFVLSVRVTHEGSPYETGIPKGQKSPKSIR
jgi:hypothetical protein